MIDRRKIPNEKQKILWNRSKQINLQAKDQYFSLLLREQISQFAFFFCQKSCKYIPMWKRMDTTWPIFFEEKSVVILISILSPRISLFCIKTKTTDSPMREKNSKNLKVFYFYCSKICEIISLKGQEFKRSQ